jgi:hypothetical protein
MQFRHKQVRCPQGNATIHVRTRVLAMSCIEPPPKEVFPPPTFSASELEPKEEFTLVPATVAKEITPLDQIDIAVPGMSGAQLSMPAAAVLYGVEELAASWLADDVTKTGSYMSTRIPKLAAYGVLIHIPLVSLFKWWLQALFLDRTNWVAQAFQFAIVNILARFATWPTFI